jgi:DNA-binding HxlR family transcriptional regulator
MPHRFLTDPRTKGRIANISQEVWSSTQKAVLSGGKQFRTTPVSRPFGARYLPDGNHGGDDAGVCRHLRLPPKKQTLLREILERIADKWMLLVIEALDGEGEMRFSDLQRRVGQISHKMLTKTLRQRERDGLVTRRVHAEVPPRVDYKLTELGESLGESVFGVWTWAGQHMPEVERARRAYDRKRANGRISREVAGV